MSAPDHTREAPVAIPVIDDCGYQAREALASKGTRRVAVPNSPLPREPQQWHCAGAQRAHGDGPRRRGEFSRAGQHQALGHLVATDELAARLGVEWTCQPVSLDLVAVFAAQEGQLTFGLDTLGDHAQAQ